MNSDAPGSIVSNPTGITCTWSPSVPCNTNAPYLNGTNVTLTVTLGLGATRAAWAGDCAGTTGLVCTVAMDNDKFVFVDTFRLFAPDIKRTDGSLTWATGLDLSRSGEGRLSVNGGLSVVRAGRQTLRHARVAGSNLVEATVSRGQGGAGAWRFDFAGQPGFKRGSLRAVAGRVGAITPDGIVFALEGKAGERIAFTFETEP